jgi:hypothetical protein
VLTATAIRPSEHLERANPKCRQANVDIYINKKGDLEMFFPLADMQPCTEELIFSGRWFPLPEKFPLPDKLLRQLGPGASPVIPAGRYPIKKIRSGYIITF